jgi:hypothetical protein
MSMRLESFRRSAFCAEKLKRPASRNSGETEVFGQSD